ncbi:hypothetical protein THAOC_19874 [Thalassiosira oceanica]|uniref:N-acetyltransferase domain-containing protein n=1 Tax=Thalassiosira oceanica TaxID=159749 RepID=K0SN05_THAOC|nr:hypothetical protein THAOC_19874 [Thalassiosira oceanica]|eukprot:EJK59857.1 hypothetical protein THAOC_19874 [Thalassiosira oceanica]
MKCGRIISTTLVLCCLVPTSTSFSSLNQASGSPRQRAPSRRSASKSLRLRLFSESLTDDTKTETEQVTRKPRNPVVSLHRVPEFEVGFLSSGFGLVGESAKETPLPPPFPYAIDLLPPSNERRISQPSRLVIRHLEDDDIKGILPEVVREFGALVDKSKLETEADELMVRVENFLFSLTVLIGLTQRVVRREKGYDRKNRAKPDHNVVCLVEQTQADQADQDGKAIYKDQIVGIAELSWQPPIPTANAPPFVLPFVAKEFISRFGPGRDAASPQVPVAYASNVLVWKNKRGRQYSKVLMGALEGIGRLWGCDDIRLHVDANEFSGRVARSLYWSLGYKGVPDSGQDSSGSFEWLNASMSNEGLYLVDGVPLLYLRKKLKD